MSARRLVVVGAGISGLAAAWSAHEALRAAGRSDEVLLLEREPAVGGKARTAKRDGYVLETGPTGFLDDEPTLDRLVERAGLEKLVADQASARRFLVLDGKLREIQMHPLKFATSGVLPPLAMLRIAREPWIRKRTDPADESVWAFAERRLGRAAADRMIAPMVLGVFAGDAKRLSLASAFPRMVELESNYGSLFRAMAKLKRERKLKGGPGGPGAKLTSFAGGLEELPRRLAERAPFTVRTGAGLRALRAVDDARPWRLALERGEELAADAVVLASDLVPARRLLADTAPPIARLLDPIPCPGVCVVGLGYGAEALARVPRGFGALIPRTEGYRILGCLWDTHLFAGRSPEGRLLVRAMLGGSTDPEAAALSEEELARAATEDLARLFGLTEAPVFREVVRWPAAIPQYELGHAARVAAVEDALATLNARTPGLSLASNYLHGIAFGKAARHGWSTGEAAARELVGRAG